MQRGHNRDTCFFSEDDYHAYRHWLGEADTLLTAHPVYSALGREPAERLAAYRGLFRPELDGEAICDIRRP